MKVKKIVAVIFAVLIICSFAASCDVGHSDSIVGKWKEMEKQIGIFEFKSNGELDITGLGYEIKAEYETTDENITITYESISYENEKTGAKVPFDTFGLYKDLDKNDKVPSGEFIEIDEPFKGTFKVTKETVNPDKLEIFLLNENGEEIDKWYFFRSYE